MEAYRAVWRDPRDASLAPQAPWIVECVAVRPEYRGQGVSRVLLQAVLDEGRRLGHAYAGISITNGNTPAQRSYESIGFKRYIEYCADYFNDQFPGTIKYRKRLA